MEMNFCRRCGTPLEHSEKHIYHCENGHTIFANCTPTAGVFFVTDSNEVLLSVRGIEPHKGMLDSFGGFLDGEENLNDAVTRELQEELTLTPSDYEPLEYLTSAIGHYPYQNESMPVLSIFYWSRLRPGVVPSPHDDVADIRTVPLDAIDFATLHDDDVRTAVRILQDTVAQTNSVNERTAV